LVVVAVVVVDFDTQGMGGFAVSAVLSRAGVASERAAETSRIASEYMTGGGFLMILSSILAVHY
jgi:hypothetical protein